MDDAAGAPIGWWRAGLLGIAAGSPIVWAVWAYMPDVQDGWGAFGVFLFQAPVVVLVTAVIGLIGVLASSQRGRERWRPAWLVLAPFVMWLVLLTAAALSGPTGSVTERRAG